MQRGGSSGTQRKAARGVPQVGPTAHRPRWHPAPRRRLGAICTFCVSSLSPANPPRVRNRGRRLWAGGERWKGVARPEDSGHLRLSRRCARGVRSLRQTRRSRASHETKSGRGRACTPKKRCELCLPHALSQPLRQQPATVPPWRRATAGLLSHRQVPSPRARRSHRRSRKCTVPGPLPLRRNRPHCFVGPSPHLWSLVRCKLLSFIACCLRSLVVMRWI